MGALTTVCQVLHTLRVGGAEMLAARLARRLSGRFRFVFACLEEAGTLGEQLRAEGFPVEVIGRRPGLDWRCPVQLARFFRDQRVDLIHAHQYTPFFYAALARALRGRLPLMFTEHGRHFPDYPRAKRKVANRFLLRSQDRVVAVGGAVRQALIDNEGIPGSRIKVIYNGIDVGLFSAAQAPRDALRSELGLPDQAMVVIQVARLDYLKDHATAIRAMEWVHQAHPEVHLLLVGEGPELEPTRKLVAQKNLGTVVHFLGLRTDIPRLYTTADLFLLTSISEGIPLTVIEAMAAGLPVVATDVGGLKEVVIEGETGLLAPSGDDRRLAEKVGWLVQDAGLRARMGEAGRQRAAHRFDEVSMARAYASTYEEMLGE